MKYPSVASLLLVFLLCLSCGGADSGRKVAYSVSNDTMQDQLPSVITGIERLPDTVYPSAGIVRHSVYMPDTTAEGLLSSLVDLYTDTPGAFTFRKGTLRDADFLGYLDTVPSEICIDWTYRTPFDTVMTKYGRWGGGTGWTGQPLYVEWPDSCIRKFNTRVSKREIILGSLDRQIHFIDYETGQASRMPIPVDNPVKGTISLDPSLNGNLYVGHGVPAKGDFGALVIDLYDNCVSHFFGRDPRALRGWNAYDSSPVRVGQFLFRPGENGTLYKFLIHAGSLSLHSSMTYTVNGRSPGMEASIAVYRNYGFTADNGGNILCVNLDNLTPVWHYRLPDDVDATPVLSYEADGVYLYVGSEVEHEGVMEAVFAKLDALTGREIWSTGIPALRADVDEKHFDGGFYASPLPGYGDCSDLIFTNVVENTNGRNGSFVAFDKHTGRISYSVGLRCYAWSSPVGFLDSDGRMYVLTADCGGRVYLFRGNDGALMCSRQVGSNFESSPVVVGNTVVVGSRGTNIYKLSIK